MDGNGELMEPEGPVAQVQPLIRPNISKNNMKCKQTLDVDESKSFSADQKYNRTIVPSTNCSSSKEDSDKTAQVTSTSPTKGRLEVLRNEVIEGVNGITNGLDVIHNVDLKHNISILSNGGTDGPSSHCDKSEICNGVDIDASVSQGFPSKSSVVLAADHKCIANSKNYSKEDIRSSEIGLCEDENVDVQYVSYKSELQMPDIMRLIQKDLSEPYSIYTYRYFIHNWPKLCFLAMDGSECVGAIVCKLDIHRKVVKRGYIAMLAVDEKYRKRKIGSNLVLKAIRAMVADDADEVVLETEITNRPALRLYENLGFVRDKRLFRYYLNGVDALRLKLWLR